MDLKMADAENNNSKAGRLLSRLYGISRQDHLRNISCTLVHFSLAAIGQGFLARKNVNFFPYTQARTQANKTCQGNYY
jgi:hypothetical protein